MRTVIQLADAGRLPDALIRLGIRFLDYRRLSDGRRGGPERQMRRKQELIAVMRRSPIAIQTDKANAQHYELPAEFFRHVLGSHLKYSGCYWPDGVGHLDEAEAAALEMVADRARLADGMRILELGCGWGAFSLWAAERFQGCRITAVSNSAPQREFIQAQCRRRGLDNLEVITADMNRFAPGERFDRIVSVEMFEHMRNWERLLGRIASWLDSDGRVFIHVFTHRALGPMCIQPRATTTGWDATSSPAE